MERALAATRLAGFFVTAARVAVLVALVTALVDLGIYSHSEAASTLAQASSSCFRCSPSSP
ncbi:hypothetical protein ID875_29430 [Streptomyces globisporus]|uniref:Uncharacterized protein n=1 Tax=Streptomyces globisporus TaxID=1908 RepID=A0A927GPZ8_STRGL|nr:hypothetical protein [Streptomyces globisporus]